MAPMSRMCLGLIVAAMVVGAQSSPLVPQTTESNNVIKARPRERVFAIGAPLLMSKYMDFDFSDEEKKGEDPEVSTPFVAPWWPAPKSRYHSTFQWRRQWWWQCPKGEKRDPMGVCRQTWDDGDR